MSQSIMDDSFPTQRIISVVAEVNTKITEVLSNPTSTSVSQSIYALLSKAENIVAILFDSVLEGEFVRNPDIKTDLGKIREAYTSEEIEGRLKDFPNKDDRLSLSKVIELIYLGTELLNKYIQFIAQLSFLVNQDKDYILSISQNKRGITKTEEYNLFLVSLELCILDIQMSESFEYASEIEYLKSIIEVGECLPEQKKKMLKKANFLLFKWYKRAEVNKKNISSIVDGEEKGNYEEEVVGYGEEWENVVDYINNHYFEGRERELKKSFRQIKDKEIETYSCRDIHLYIKYYKEIDKNIDKLDKIIEVIDSKKQNNKIYSVIFQYAVNNRFSLFLEKSSDKNEIYDEYQKIKGDNSQNYFPQYKFINKITSIVNNNLQKENLSINEIEESESFINNKLEPEYQKYKANMEWSLQHSNFIYRVAYDECIIDDIFIYSSFVLPAPNKEARDKYEILSSNYQTLKTQIEPLKKVSSLLLEVSKNRIQVIELMGIFLAVIAFVMSSVSGFNFVTDIWSAFLFMIIFGTCLISFLLVLILITRHNENIFKRHRWMILGFYIVMLGLMYGLSTKIDNNNISNKEKQENNISEIKNKDSNQGRDTTIYLKK